MPKPALTKPKQRYHHGDLRRALIDGAVTLIAEQGVHALSLREAARRAGVSSGAPYRHFADKEALLVAIAEDAHRLYQEHVERELGLCAAGDGIGEFRARGIALVTFAAAHPVHFRLMCSRDVGGQAEHELLQPHPALVELVRAKPSLVSRSQTVALAGECLAYGLARMLVDAAAPPERYDQTRVRKLAVEVLDVLGRGLY